MGLGCSSHIEHLAENRTNTLLPAQNDILTDEEKYKIRKTWKILKKDPETLGVNLFLKIFSVNPHMKGLFPWEGETIEELLSDSKFKYHAERFLHVISSAVDHVDIFDDVMKPSLVLLGEHHVVYMDYNEDYFETMNVSMLQVIEECLGEEYSQDVAEAWWKLVAMVTKHVKSGYLKKYNARIT